MSVWLCVPSAKPVDACNAWLDKWTHRGYYTAVFRDKGAGVVRADRTIFGDYPGYAAAVNVLCREVKRCHPHAEWFVLGGDDIFPEENKHAFEIAQECKDYFDGTLGVMQPTGDRWLEDADGLSSPERACVSPWLGREWVERAYEGEGPLFTGYYHFYVDEELKHVASRLGKLWQRPDLTHYHNNWQRTKGRTRPDYLRPAAIKHPQDRLLFETRKEQGFPGHTLLEGAHELQSER